MPTCRRPGSCAPSASVLARCAAGGRGSGSAAPWRIPPTPAGRVPSGPSSGRRCAPRCWPIRSPRWLRTARGDGTRQGGGSARRRCPGCWPSWGCRSDKDTLTSLEGARRIRPDRPGGRPPEAPRPLPRDAATGTGTAAPGAVKPTGSPRPERRPNPVERSRHRRRTTPWIHPPSGSVASRRGTRQVVAERDGDAEPADDAPGSAAPDGAAHGPGPRVPCKSRPVAGPSVATGSRCWQTAAPRRGDRRRAGWQLDSTAPWAQGRGTVHLPGTEA